MTAMVCRNYAFNHLLDKFDCSNQNLPVQTMVSVPQVQAKMSEEIRKSGKRSQNSKEKIATAETEEGVSTHRTETGDVLSEDWFTDPENPLNWSHLRKWTIIWLLVITNMIA